MSEHSELKAELVELRRIIKDGFDDFSEWRKTTDVALRGQDGDDVWGVNQKLRHHKKKIDDHETRILTIEINHKKALAWVVGAGSGAGLVGGIIFNIVQAIIG
jgi:hypothetical protein